MATNGVKAPAPDLQEIHDFLIDLATRAGEVITGAKPLVNGVDSKKNSSDLVTEYDRAVEAMVSKELRARYPTY
ncbi:hypothetical protein EMPG_16691, partial [Blastomyces silverae]